MALRDATRLLLPLLALWGCAGAPPEPRLYDPGQLAPEQARALKQAEQAYRAQDAAFDGQRDALAGDPVTACWLTRFLVRDILWARERRDVGQGEVLRAAAGRADPVETRAREQLLALGGAAASTLVKDLLESSLGDRRELGVELLGGIGPAALPDVDPVLADGDPRVRRSAVRVLAAMPFGPEVGQRLRRAAADPDFGVRGEALRGLGGGGEAEAALLRSALAGDADPFVRRAAAQALGGFRDQAAAVALIDYLERCKRERESQGEQTAQAALQAISGSRGPRTVEAWRAWSRSWDPAAGR